MSKLKYLMLIFVAVFISCTRNDTTTRAVPPSNYRQLSAGTANNPYRIADLENLRWLSENPKAWGRAEKDFGLYRKKLWTWKEKRYHFIQTADIDATDTMTWNDGEGFSPIGTYKIDLSNRSIFENAKHFYSHYDGNNHYIDNLFIDKKLDDRFTGESIGLFGSVSNSVIKNIRLRNVYINTFHENFVDLKHGAVVGGIVGRLLNYNYYDDVAVLENSFVSGTITVETGTQVGGAVGFSYIASMSGITSLVDVNVPLGIFTGGIVGWIVNSTLIDSYHIGDITSKNFNEDWGMALAGVVGSGMSMVKMYGSSIVEWESKINNVYSVSTPQSVVISGLVGKLENTHISNSFWDTETSGITIPFIDFDNPLSTNIHGLPTEKMKLKSTFTDAGWDFENVWAIDKDVNGGYPHLLIRN